MQLGQTIGGRFVLERLAGRGGMGEVFRAIDTAAGSEVAIKILSPAPAGAQDRFLREAKVLSKLSHANIVRYVDQGVDRSTLWLAMEWLDGKNLAETLESGPLPLPSALRVAEQIALGLTAAHASGVIHRDIKPSNIILKAGNESDVRLIDFGIAQLSEATVRLTGTGQFIGTAGYMAPEQISSPEKIDHRVDLFSLGCLLFETIAGSPAFPGGSNVAVMAKILADDPPKLSSLGAGVPQALDDLVQRLLAKRREQRPESATEVARELRSIADQLDGAACLVPAPRLTQREQQLVGVVLAVLEGSPESEQAALAAALELSARVYPVGPRAHLLVLKHAGSADEQAARAAECALAVRRAMPSARLAVATGLADSEALSVGPAIDRCTSLLGHLNLPPGASARDTGEISVDDATAGLLRGRFALVQRERVHYLEGAIAAPPSVRPHGRAPIVGRDKELRFLAAEIDEALEEPCAKTLLISGEAGAGKSRVLEQLLSDLAGRGLRPLYARARVVGAGSALAMARQLVRAFASRGDDTTPRELQRALSERLAELCSEEELPRAVSFLVELVAGSGQGDAIPELCAARNEPRILAEWLRRTFVEWLLSQARRGPLLLVLEDLHWSDAATVAWLGEALRAGRELPLVVLATSRPEVFERLPELRAQLAPQELKLGPMGKRSSETLARELFGAEVSAQVVQRVVELAHGNPFFLEELVRQRSMAAHQSDSFTLVAVLQARLGQLDPELRRTLRAASVFGRTFRAQGVAALLGADQDHAATSQLRALAAEELIEPAPSGVADEWSFRHDLLRDSAYATLPEDERGRAHGLAADWLSHFGNVEPLVLVDHLERAGRKEDAAAFLLRAAELCNSVGSLREALELLTRAEAHVAERQRGQLAALTASVHAMLTNWSAARAASAEALRLVPPGTDDWYRAAAIQVFAGLSVGDAAVIGSSARALSATQSRPEPTGPYAFSIMALVAALGMAGQKDGSAAMFERIEAALDGEQRDPSFFGWGNLAKSSVALFVRDDPGEATAAALRAAQVAGRLGDRLLGHVTAFFLAQALLECGDFRGASEAAQSLLDHRGVLPYLDGWGAQILAQTELRAGREAQALATLDRISQRDPPLLARVALIRARVALSRGDEIAASAIAREVIAARAAALDVGAAAEMLGHLALDHGELTEAERMFALARAVFSESGSKPSARSRVELGDVKLLLSQGRTGEARARANLARDRLHRLTASMPSSSLRQSWLALPEHVELLALSDAAPSESADFPRPTHRPEGEMGAGFGDEESTVDVTAFGERE